MVFCRGRSSRKCACRVLPRVPQQIPTSQEQPSRSDVLSTLCMCTARIALMNTDTKKFRHCLFFLDALTDYIHALFARIKKRRNYVPA